MKNKKKMCFGVIIGTRAYFNSELAKDVRKQLLETLTKEGYDYVILPEDATPTGSSSIETREDGLKCAKLFRENRERIDGIIVSLPNFGFEIGIINAISVADLNVPVLVQACDDENDKVDLDSRRDAFCGKISVCNNLYQYGIPFTDTTLHTYSIYSDLLAADINKFAAICRDKQPIPRYWISMIIPIIKGTDINIILFPYALRIAFSSYFFRSSADFIL